MTFERAMLIVVCVLFGLTILLNITGCSMLQRASEVIFKPGQTESIVPDTPKKQLWQTIKGLTPNWLAIPVIALGAVAMFNGAAKLGMSCIVFGSVNLFMALATSRFGFWMAVCGFIGSVAAVASTMLAKNKALKEVVFGAQRIKNYSIEQLNGNRAGFNRVLKEEQKHKSTKKIVQKIKSKAKLLGKM